MISIRLFSEANLRKVLLAAFVLIVVACHENRKDKDAVDHSLLPECNSVTYSISTISGKNHKVDHMTFMSVSFDSTRSITAQMSAITGFSDTTKFYRQKGNSMVIVSQKLPWTQAVFRMKDENYSYFADSLSPEFTDDTATILGYSCRKAVITRRSEKWEIWFTEKLQLHDPTNAIISHPKIDGAILKMRRSFSFDKFYAATEYKVVGLKLKERIPEFRFPDEGTIYKGEIPPRDHYSQQFDSLTSRQDTIPWQFKDKFLGKWKYLKKQPSLEVERYGEIYVVRFNGMTNTEIWTEERSSPVTARFYKRKMWFKIRETWEWAELCDEDKLCSSLCDNCRLVKI